MALLYQLSYIGKFFIRSACRQLEISLSLSYYRLNQSTNDFDGLIIARSLIFENSPGFSCFGIIFHEATLAQLAEQHTRNV